MALDPGGGHNFRIVSRRKDLVRPLEFFVRHDLFNHRNTGVTEESDDSLPGNAIEKCTVRNRSINDATLGNEDIRSGEFRDIAQTWASP